MMDFMRDGGFGMWLMVATTLATIGAAFARGRDHRALTFTVGLVAVLIEGMLGLSLGLATVSKHYVRFPDPVAAIGTGLGELSHNGTLAAMLATGLGLAALLSPRAPVPMAR